MSSRAPRYSSFALVALLALSGCGASKSAPACADDADCPVGGGICQSGSCTILPCALAGDCPSGACTLGGTCQAVECSASNPCSPGFECTSGLCQSPGAAGLDKGVSEWDFLTPPNPLGPDALREDAALPDGHLPDAAPPDGHVPDAAPPIRDAAPPDGHVPDAAPDAALPPLSDFFRLLFTYNHGTCGTHNPAAPKDLWLQEGAGGVVDGLLTGPDGAGGGFDLVGTRVGNVVHLAALAPVRTEGSCVTELSVTLQGVLGPAGRYDGLADWHELNVQPCDLVLDCHRFDTFEGGPVP